jgi:hypothetical protein
MKSVIYSLLVVCVSAFAVPSADAALIGAWRQDEGSGDLIDSTGRHPAGVATGAPTYARPGVPNGTYGAITVTGAAGTAIEYGPSDVDEFFTIGSDNNNPVMNLDPTSAFTVMGWVNPMAPTAARTYRFLSTGSGAGADRGWGFGLRLPSTAGTGSSVRFTTFGVADNDSSTFDVTFGNWVHLAATYNNGQISYFLNGNALDSDTSLFGDQGAAARLVVGGRLGGSDTDQMNGLIDGVRVYDEVLTAEQIRQAAADSVPEPSTMLLGVGVACVALARRRRS